jgi:hypothetical protein
MNRDGSLQQRIDSLKRKCSTGYGCGSSCISLRKECRTRPGSAIGRERLKRLMALAAGGPSSQRGIGTVKAKEAGQMAGSIATRRGEKATQLRGARAQQKPGKEQTLDQEISRLQKLQKAHEENANRSGRHPDSLAREVIAGLQALNNSSDFGSKKPGKPLRWNIHGKNYEIPESKLQGLSPRQVTALIYTKITGYKPGPGQGFGDWFAVPFTGKSAAETAAKAAAQARQPGPSSGDRPMAPAGTPRGEADRAAKAGDPDYEFARASAVGNAGEDIGDSARHRRNAFRTIEEAEASGQVEKVLTRDNLMKNFPTDLISGSSESNILSRLEAHFCLKAFPSLSPKDVDSYVKAQDRREATARNNFGRPSNEKGVDAKTVRKQYFDAFQSLRKVVDDGKDSAPGELRKQIQRKLSDLVSELRGQEGTGYFRTYRDPYNPTANVLTSMQKRMYQRGTTSVFGQLNAFAVALKKEGQMVEARPTMERALDAGTKIMEGSSMAAAFGQQGNGKWRFNPADHYVGHARREGGRNVGGTPDAATDTIVKGLGFRGLQYGNSVTDDERKHHVQMAAEALVDLADATGLPDSAIGLNGTLGLAIGARGRGGAVAHYEPTMKVINLTRKKGVGSLSHEWGHALDNYAAGGASFLSGNSGAPEKRAAMNQVKSAWTTSGFTQQVYDSIREVKKAGGLLTEEYWLSDVEMFARSFEAHVSLKLEKAGRANTYLTREFDDSGMKKGNAAERRLGDGLWPTRKQAEAMEPMFDALLAQIKKADFPGASNRRDSRGERIQRLVQEAYQAAAADHRAASSLQARIDALRARCGP